MTVSGISRFESTFWGVCVYGNTSLTKFYPFDLAALSFTRLLGLHAHSVSKVTITESQNRTWKEGEGALGAIQPSRPSSKQKAPPQRPPDKWSCRNASSFGRNHGSSSEARSLAVRGRDECWGVRSAESFGRPRVITRLAPL